jgi:hypothetical protein
MSIIDQRSVMRSISAFTLGFSMPAMIIAAHCIAMGTKKCSNMLIASTMLTQAMHEDYG